MSETRLIVGLGNPGKDYMLTRHNLGFMVVEALAEQERWSFQSSSLTKGYWSEGQIGGQDLCLLLPMTYMNNSGVAVKALVNAKEIDPSNLLVVCDDLNLPFQQLRLKPKGSDGGHNGLSSIIYHLGTDLFSRLRLGIGAPGQGEDAADYVLENFKKQEKAVLGEFVNSGVECCRSWLENGTVKTMDIWNKRISLD